MECFCFEEQKLLAGEEVDMPLLFFIDKDILEDLSASQVTDVVLSYTFFRLVCKPSLHDTRWFLNAVTGHGEISMDTSSQMLAKTLWRLQKGLQGMSMPRKLRIGKWTKDSRSNSRLMLHFPLENPLQIHDIYLFHTLTHPTHTHCIS
jgi:hypothetical protein